jgi:hypothetical protein
MSAVICRAALLAWVLALSACTQVYFKRFEVAPEDPTYSARAQFEDIKKYVRERGFPVDKDERNYASFQLATNKGAINPSAPSDYLEVKLLPEDKVELVLVRISSGPNYSNAQVKVFQETLQNRVQERNGKAISVRLVGDQKGLRDQK